MSGRALVKSDDLLIAEVAAIRSAIALRGWVERARWCSRIPSMKFMTKKCSGESALRRRWRRPAGRGGGRLKIALLALVSTMGSLPQVGAAEPETFREWGRESLAAIRRDLWMDDRGLYAEDARPNRRDASDPWRRRQPSYMWGVGIQITALAAAAKLEPETYLPELEAYLRAIEVYWAEHHGLYAYDVQPGPKDADRYYDDNAWVALGFVEAYRLTGKLPYLERAREIQKFVFSGEDEKLGGGLYWREQELKSKNTCTNAPAIAAQLEIYLAGENKEDLKSALRVYRWTRDTLQDEDGLYFDNIRMDGSVDERKFSYNSALMLRATCLFYEISKDQRYLDEAKRIGAAAEARWVVDGGEGGIRDGGRFAHHLLEAFHALQKIDPQPHRLEMIGKSLGFVHAKVRDSHGRYASNWSRPINGDLRHVTLLDAASAARAFWIAADRKPATVASDGLEIEGAE